MSPAKAWTIRMALILAILIAILTLLWVAQGLADRSCAEVGARAKLVGRSYICVTPDGRVVEP